MRWTTCSSITWKRPDSWAAASIRRRRLQTRWAASVPADGYFAQARTAESRKQYSTAEAHLRRAIELAPHQVDRLIDLAKFLSKQGRIPESDQSLARADKIAPNLPRLMYAKAEMYIQSGRNLDLAKELLQRYLTCSLTPDDPPRSDATKLLRQAQERARNGHGG